MSAASGRVGQTVAHGAGPQQTDISGSDSLDTAAVENQFLSFAEAQFFTGFSFAGHGWPIDFQPICHWYHVLSRDLRVNSNRQVAALLGGSERQRWCDGANGANVPAVGPLDARGGRSHSCQMSSRSPERGRLGIDVCFRL